MGSTVTGTEVRWHQREKRSLNSPANGHNGSPVTRVATIFGATVFTLAVVLATYCQVSNSRLGVSFKNFRGVWPWLIGQVE